MVERAGRGYSGLAMRIKFGQHNFTAVQSGFRPIERTGGWRSVCSSSTLHRERRKRAHIAFDEYAIPSPGSPQTYDLSLGLGIPRSPSLYPHGHLDASPPSLRASGQVPHIPARPTHTFVAPQPDLMLQYHLPGGHGTFIGLNAPYPSTEQHSSPQGVYAATSDWTGAVGYGGRYDPGDHPLVQDLSTLINSSHTVQTQQHNAANMVPSALPSGGAQSSWTGSIDLTTGVFQRSVEHPRLRTAQACEKCRIRKAKCSGENPCKRCVDKGLQCEYAPERKMRGPNKNKRKAAVPQKRSAASPAAERTIPDSASTPTSSDSDSAASGHQRAESSPSTLGSCVANISSSHSSPAPAHRASPEACEAFRPRSATVGQGPSGSVCNAVGAIPVASSRPRPPRLDLTVAQETYSRLQAEHARTAGQLPYPVPVETGRDTRTALPAYLAQSYGRTALHNSPVAHQGLPGAFGSRPGPVSQDANISHFVHPSPVIAIPSSFPAANEHASASSPEIPASVAPLSLAYDATGSLMYPEGTSAFESGFDAFDASPVSSDDGHLCAFGEMADALNAKAFDQDGWHAAAAAVHAQLADDETPRATTNSLLAELLGPVGAMAQ